MSSRPITSSLLAKYGGSSAGIGTYPTVNDWNGDVTYREYCDALSTVSGDLSVQLHLPFCALRCLYCDSHATVNTHRDEVTEYITRLETELELLHSVMGGEPVVREMHWGGGTPNFLADGQLVRVFDLVAERFALSSNVECSVEADPRLVTTTQLRWLRGLGFNQLRFGVQDLDPLVQHAIGRVQSIALITDVVERAREQGFQSLSLDVLFGLPHQTTASLGDTIDAVIELAPDRVTCRGYVHTPWLLPHQRRIDEATLPDCTARFALYQLAVRRLTEAGYLWIGPELFAKPEDALFMAAATGQLHRDHMGYTASRSRSFVGGGVSAISEVGGVLVQNECALTDWQRAVDNGRLPFARGHRLTDDDRTRRSAIRALTTTLALRRDALPDNGGRIMQSFQQFEADGLVMIGERMITVTPTGRYFLSSLVSALHPERDSFSAFEPQRLSRIV